MSVNRIVIVVTAVLSLAVGLLPAIANLDWTSTAGILTSLGAVAGLVLKWLDGWQKHELTEANLEAARVYNLGRRPARSLPPDTLKS